MTSSPVDFVETQAGSAPSPCKRELQELQESEHGYNDARIGTRLRGWHRRETQMLRQLEPCRIALGSFLKLARPDGRPYGLQ